MPKWNEKTIMYNKQQTFLKQAIVKAINLDEHKLDEANIAYVLEDLLENFQQKPRNMSTLQTTEEVEKIKLQTEYTILRNLLAEKKAHVKECEEYLIYLDQNIQTLSEKTL